MQTRIDGTHDILPVAGSPTAVPDHARLLVMWPRESDGKMRRDGSDAARGQPQHPVAERGRVHGAPELSPRMVERIADKISVVCSIRKEGRRWRQQRPNNDRLRGPDKRPHIAARGGRLFSMVWKPVPQRAPPSYNVFDGQKGRVLFGIQWDDRNVHPAAVLPNALPNRIGPLPHGPR